MPRTSLPPIVLIRRRLKDLDNGCRVWLGRTRYGVPLITLHARGPEVGTCRRLQTTVRRVVYGHDVQPVPPGCDVVPTCGTPLCCHPAHLTAAPRGRGSRAAERSRPCPG